MTERVLRGGHAEKRRLVQAARNGRRTGRSRAGRKKAAKRPIEPPVKLRKGNRAARKRNLSGTAEFFRLKIFLEAFIFFRRQTDRGKRMKQEMPKQYQPQQFESEMYREWEEKGYFKAHRDPAKKPFTIIMPPPNITGQLHMGHAHGRHHAGRAHPLSPHEGRSRRCGCPARITPPSRPR